MPSIRHTGMRILGIDMLELNDSPCVDRVGLCYLIGMCVLAISPLLILLVYGTQEWLLFAIQVVMAIGFYLVHRLISVNSSPVYHANRVTLIIKFSALFVYSFMVTWPLFSGIYFMCTDSLLSLAACVKHVYQSVLSLGVFFIFAYPLWVKLYQLSLLKYYQTQAQEDKMKVEQNFQKFESNYNSLLAKKYPKVNNAYYTRYDDAPFNTIIKGATKPKPTLSEKEFIHLLQNIEIEE